MFRFRPMVEVLETRETPSTSPLPPVEQGGPPPQPEPTTPGPTQPPAPAPSTLPPTNPY